MIECEWDGYYCFIGIWNNYVVLYFILIELCEIYYNISGWYEFSLFFEVDILWIYLVYLEDDLIWYVVYINMLMR